MLGTSYRMLRQSVVDMQNLFGLLEKQPQLQDPPDARKLIIEGGPPSLEFKNVKFGYGPERTIFEDLSFTVEPGQTVGLVGPSGCGKSTVLRLLSRMYWPTAGELYIAGQPLSELDSNSVRANISMVPQDVVCVRLLLWVSRCYCVYRSYLTTR